MNSLQVITHLEKAIAAGRCPATAQLFVDGKAHPGLIRVRRAPKAWTAIRMMVVNPR